MKKTIRKEFTKSNGITLLSLSITIVVLIILAGVSINLLTGDNGVITKSKNIRRNIEQAKIEGQEKINSLKDEEEYVEDGSAILDDNDAPDISMEITNVTSNSFKVNVNVTETGSGLAKVEYSIDDGEHYITPNNNQAKSYTFTDLKVGSEEYKVKVKVTDVNNNSSYATKTIDVLKIGDYVNYTYDAVPEGYFLASTVSEYSDQTITQTIGLKWRILNIEYDGSIDLISATPTDTSIYLKGALGYNNGVWAVNDMCEKLYSNTNLRINARSINLRDIEKQETENGKAARLAYITKGNASYGTTGVKYGSTKTYKGNLYYPNLYAYENGSGIDTSITKTDGINDSDNTTIGYEIPTTEIDSKSYSEMTVTQTWYENYLNNTNYGPAGEILTASNSDYWLASRYLNCLEFGYAEFGLHYVSDTRLDRTIGIGMYRSHKYSYGNGRSLRPVVSLALNTIDISLGKDEDGAWQIR